MDKKGGIMKGYLFGLGAMIVGSVVFWFLVFGFFMLRTIFLILSPKDDGGGYGKSRIIIELGPMGL